MKNKNILNFKREKILIITLLFFNSNIYDSKSIIQITISDKIQKKIPKHFFAGEKYKIILNKYPKYKYEKINMKISDNNIADISGEYLITKLSGRECLTIFTKNNNTTFCFSIYENKLTMLENNTILTLVFNSTKQLNFGENLVYKSNYPEIISVDEK